MSTPTKNFCNFRRGPRQAYDSGMRPALCTIILTLIIGARVAQACDCAGPSPGPCQLLAGDAVVFVGTVVAVQPDGYRFRIDENLTPYDGKSLFVSAGPCSYEFAVGKQYVVFADAWNEDLHVSNCSPTMQVQNAQALLPQLRAMRDKQPIASVYGTLRRTLRNDAATWDDSYVRPLANITVRLKSGNKTFAAKTDQKGVYAFYGLGPGAYQASADLPPTLEIAQQILREPEPPFTLARNECYDYDLNALPTGEIDGRVIGTDGKPLRGVSAGLFRADRYAEDDGRWEFQKDSEPFRFDHLPAGDYVLLFNSPGGIDPNNPYPKTFYPGVTDRGHSALIHLADGQKITNADIHVTGARPTRALTIKLLWEGDSSEYMQPWIIIDAGEGVAPYPKKSDGGAYVVNLLSTSHYLVRARALCQTSLAELETNSLMVDGADASASTITLTFPKRTCEKKQ
jgi:hypothetical protein